MAGTNIYIYESYFASPSLGAQKLHKMKPRFGGVLNDPMKFQQFQIRCCKHPSSEQWCSFSFLLKDLCGNLLEPPITLYTSKKTNRCSGQRSDTFRRRTRSRRSRMKTESEMWCCLFWGQLMRLSYCGHWSQQCRSLHLWVVLQRYNPNATGD